MKVENWNLGKIKPYHQNAKLHNIDWITKSIEEFKVDQPIVVDGDGVIIKGHGRLEAAQRLGLKTFPVIVRTDLTPEQVRLARIADNRSAEAGWDTDALELELSELDMSAFDFDVAELGVSDEWLTELGVESGEDAIESDPADDEIPEVEESTVKLGDIWQLGNHRLMCGDSTSVDDVGRLMDGNKSEILFTSPPYADMRTYSGNDLSIGTLKKFIPAFYQHCEYMVINLGIKRKDHEVVEYWQEYITEAKQYGYKFLSWNVWDKTQSGSMASATAMFSMTHEWLLVFGKKMKRLNRTIQNQMEKYKSRHGENFLNGTHRAVRQADGSMSINSTKAYTHHQLHSCISQTPEKSSIRSSHPATFPVGLPLQYIDAMTDSNDIIVDPFLGSGTTLIACEKTNRICYGMEIDPHYCDVIIKRWEDFTGQQAVKL